MVQHAATYLFVPADGPERFDKALASGADVVIIDLEDAVAPAAKDAARAALAAWLATATARVAVRINGFETPWFLDDLALCRSPKVQAIVVPKAEHADHLALCAKTAPQAQVLPLIESALGFEHLRSLAAVQGVARLVFGSIDFQLDLGIEGEGEALLYFRSQLVLVSKLHGLQAPVDGVTTSVHDSALVHADALRSRALGFGGKLCIHPLQVATVAQAFRPSEQEIDWAQRVISAAEQAAGAAATVDGKMIDRPVVLRAQTILERVR